ncbi:hypothetical protein HPP92_025588 [Vanilla planifolia]|uniref:MSP domain-containing protein n=1 Tax=Vanilla planifolia TaxID=51239 RepID=A0A835PG52_VANPL|nr:hypothetical protein HPP92_025864 [Vanilla planifolia]KAG0454284.1 hypothetical protein HPP92_025588 [Vanilla planifolia]
MSGESFLRIHPLELKFSFELNKQSSCTIQMTNQTEEYVAFKIKTTNPKKYSVRPNTGIVLPSSTCEVLVTMQAQKEAPLGMQCKDKFLVQSVVAARGATVKDITSEIFNKEPNKVVEEFKLRVVYVPGNPPSPVPEEAEEGSSPGSNLLENGEAHLSSSVPRSHDEPHKFKSLEVSALISKLNEEKTSALEKNQKLQHDLEVLRRESNNNEDAELLLDLPEGFGGAPEAGGLLVGELDVDNPDNTGAAKHGREAEEDVLLGRHAAEKTASKERDGVDATLVAKERTGEARDGVADGPGGVALEVDDLVGALHHRPPDALEHSTADLMLLQCAQQWHPTHVDARPQRHRAVPVLPHHVRLHPLI